MIVRLTTGVFGFGLGRAAAVTFFDFGLCRWRLITLGDSKEPALMASGGEMRSSTGAGCAGVSLLAAATSSRSAFASAPCESEMPAVISARGGTTAPALRGGVLSSIAASTPTPSGMRRPNNTILSKMLLRLKSVPVQILRFNEATRRRLPQQLHPRTGRLLTRLTTGLTCDPSQIFEPSPTVHAAGLDRISRA